jgi:feruloyl esterase
MSFHPRFALVLLLALLSLNHGGAALSAAQLAVPEGSASGPDKLAAMAPVGDCAALGSADISGAVGAPTHITSAAPVAGGEPAPYCDVKGYIEPQIGFEVRLPLSAWTQRFVQTGCGGLCGNLNIRLGNDDGCLPSTRGEIALASTDMGHSGGMDGQFGAKDYQLRIDFAYRGVHLTTLAAKALIAKFYGQGPTYSYFAGCSDGGREALMEAERYPDDFNGITAGAPAMNFTTQNTFYHGWNVRANTGADGKPILTADKLPILHNAALAACDAADGLRDGIISDPVGCKFDPAIAQCKPGQDPASCLTPVQAGVARDLYAGAHASDGAKLVIGGPLPGSELAWAGVYIPQPGQDRVMSGMISTGTLKYLAYETNPPESYTLAHLKFDRVTFAATTRLHALYDATDPDLAAFAAKGGKLILWHGLADPHISPLNTIAYYTAMQQIMGKPAVDKFARLYLFPGGYHCGGGEGPFNVDLLSPIMSWVERGSAPAALIASHASGGDREGPPAGVPPAGRPPMGPPNGAAGDRPPAGPGGQPPNMAGAPPPDMLHASHARPDRTRPVFPYPLTAKYIGSGSIDDARNFVAGEPEAVPAARLDWLGSSFYAAHYELWCKGNGAAMNCKPTP